MPKVANGIDLDFDVTRSRADNLEVEIKYRVQPELERDAAGARLSEPRQHGQLPRGDRRVSARDRRPPDVTLYRREGRVKRGVGLNVFQELYGFARAFARVGWSTGDLESFAYTEVENTIQFGGDVTGQSWRRPDDRIGLAFVSNGISELHREYLRLGGLGFLLGDGGLRYARETIVEHYYNVHVWRGLSFAEDIQLIVNPGYNADRGPVWVFSLRGHLEF